MRLDRYLAEAGLAKSRESAAKLIKAGSVFVAGRAVTKPSFELDEANPPEIELTDAPRYVSRGGLKLERALELFGVDVTGLEAVDIGASTGGFTDCLLQHGAARVRAVDVGHGQLASTIEADPRVTSFEGINARYMKPEDIGGRTELAVCDVSFISLTLIFEAVRELLCEDGRFIALIKPQFEAGRDALGKGGIVRDRNVHREVVERVLASAESHGLHCAALGVSPIAGGDGNREYLALFDSRGGLAESEIARVVFGD